MNNKLKKCSCCGSEIESCEREIKKCPCCGSDAIVIPEDDIVHFGTDKWYKCSNENCVYYHIDLLPDDWQSRPLEDALQKEIDAWRNTATILSVKLNRAVSVLKYYAIPSEDEFNQLPARDALVDIEGE